MWRLKQLIPKDQSGLEGKTLDVGSLRLQIRSTIAEGGFSRVYLARDAQSGEQIALKHIICIDSESLDLVKKEVIALKAFRGHPNIITLQAQSMYDMNGNKECFLAMEYCEKTMVDVLDNRGSCYYEEKQLLLMFRDVCNAVYAMHSQMPPVAHRDLKAENLLLGSDGQWKLCDFGSISTNHKRFEKAAEMGLEEDMIRKHTTPAYRAPEMWDLFRRDIICEKVDIWALGCLLYRMAYLKNAFDGESKLQILNGNYRFPEFPKYSPIITGLIKEMLNSIPEERPSAMQVWQRVNNALPLDNQKSVPDRAPKFFPSNDTGGNTGQERQHCAMPSRAPPPPPHKVAGENLHSTSRELDQTHSLSGGKGGGLGSFWLTQHAQNALYDKDHTIAAKDRTSNELLSSSKSNSLQGMQSAAALLSDSQSNRSESTHKEGTLPSTQRKDYGGGPKWDDDKDDEHDEQARVSSSIVPSYKNSHVPKSQQTTREELSDFVADFENASIFNPEKEDMGAESQHAELESLRAALKQVQKEVLELSSRCKKLTSICGSQQLEIQQLRSTLATANSQQDSPQAKEPLSQTRRPVLFSSQQNQERQAGPIWDEKESVSSLGLPVNEPRVWTAFSKDVPKMPSSVGKEKRRTSPKYSRDGYNSQYGSTTSGAGTQANKERNEGSDEPYWSRGVPCASNHSQPAGWSAF